MRKTGLTKFSSKQKGDKKILALFDPIYMYDERMPPAVADTLISLNFITANTTIHFKKL